MSEKDPKQSTVTFSREDIAAVDDFRKITDTSVLTIMFTDIKGFTRITEEKGETYANDLRRKHDDIIVPVVEENNTGKVIKHIGDAIMAIFAEPSVAVAKALTIQQQLDAFNKENEDLEDVIVRIGLHMGQVTTENAVDTDVFGRHVNRASRIEGLADGGQIYMTYPVFDSAKGWLLNREGEVGWVLHGYYFVKGIREPIAVYEAFNADLTKPAPPKNAKKKRTVPISVLAIVGVLAVVVAVLVYLLVAMSKNLEQAELEKKQAEEAKTAAETVKKTPVITFINMPNAPVFIDHKDKVIVDGEPGQRLRKLLTPKIEPGKHILHWTYSYLSRLYADITVKEGENFIEPIFKRNNLPNVYQMVTYKEGEKNVWEKNFSKEYKTYDKNNTGTDRKADLSFTVSIKPAETEGDLAYTYTYKIVIDGKAAAEDTFTEISSIKNSKGERKKKVVWKDKDEYYFFRLYYYQRGKSTNFEIQGCWWPWLEED